MMNSNKDKTDFLELISTMIKTKYPAIDIVLITIENQPNQLKEEMAIVSTLQQDDMQRLLKLVMSAVKVEPDLPKPQYDA